MPYVTEYYLDLKIVDGNKPVKRRVVIFDRRTDTKLLTIPADQISNDGMFLTTTLDRFIPAKQIYAIAFDDEGDRQLAGADKLSIKTKLTWMDKALAYHIEFYPGEPTYERASGTPLILTNKPYEKEFVNGVLTQFNETQPTITPYGLLIHEDQTNLLKMEVSSTTTATTTLTTKSDLPVIQMRETFTFNPSFKIEFDLTKFGTNISTANRSCKFVGYFKPIGSARKLNISINNINFGVVYSCSTDWNTITHTTYTASNPYPYATIFTDPRFPDYKCIMLAFYVPANISLWNLSISTSSMIGPESYTGSVNTGFDIWNLYLTDGINTLPQISIHNLFNPTTAKLNLSSVENKYSYASANFSTALDSISTVSNENSLLLDIIMTPRFGKNNLTGNKAHSFIYNLLTLQTDNRWVLNAVKYEGKTPCDVNVDLDWNVFDTIRIRAFADKTDAIPDSIKIHYGITKTEYPYSCIVVIYENITKGTRIIKKDSYVALAITRSLMGGISTSIARGSYYIQKVQIWTKPLPEDWVAL